MDHIYMQVTKDKYELPLAVADSLKELGEMVGRSADSISSSISRKCAGWVRVDMGDEDNE